MSVDTKILLWRCCFVGIAILSIAVLYWVEP